MWAHAHYCLLRSQQLKPLLIVDAANVVGSVPDGWWRDRAGAARRLRDALAAAAAAGLPDGPADLRQPLDVVLVVEGAARRIAEDAVVRSADTNGAESSGADVRVVAAPGSGDDTIVDLVRREGGPRTVAVVTADRGLRDRVVALGARVLGPRAVRRDPG